MIAQGWLLLGAAVLGAAGGAWVTNNALSTQHEQYKATVAKDAQDRALAVLVALQAAGERVKEGESKISKVREDNAKADAELDRLNRCIKSGTCGLRVAAKCPSSTSVHAATSDGAGRDSAAGARLDAAAESSYLDFLRGYKEQLKVLRICKAYGETQKPLN